MVGDLRWYLNESARNRAPSPRCPFASIHRCPRYFASLSLLGEAGSTRIEPKLEKRLFKKWKKTEFWPSVAEQDTSIMGSQNDPSIFCQFCPEVLYERFGWFANFLSGYADETDQEFAHERLAARNADRSDWHWIWSEMSPMHYLECPFYSLLSRTSDPQRPTDVIAVRPGMFGITIDLRALWRKVFPNH